MSNHKTIWKFVIPIQDEVTVTMPSGAKLLPLLDAGDTFGTLHIWAEVYPDNPTEERHLRVIGTGHPVPPRVEHVASAVISPFVWHLYDTN